MPASILLLLACGGAESPAPRTASGQDAPAPQVLSVQVAPMAPRTDDLLTATVDWTAGEPDAAEVTWAWTVDGVLVSSTGPTLDGKQHFDKGQVVELTVTVRDEAGFDRRSSEPISVLGTVPGPPVVQVSPNPAFDQDNLLCDIVELAADVDLDAIRYTTRWQVDGVDHPGDIVPYRDTRPGQTWACTVTPSDEDGEGTPASASVAIEACQGRDAAARVAEAPEGFTLVAADLDGDGDDDIVAGAGDTVFWVESLGNSTFGVRQVIDADARGTSDVAVADFDGDGDLDVTATSQDDDEVSWWENRGDSWTRRRLTNQATFARGVHVDDLDGDGDPDVLFAAAESNEVGWFENRGRGSFADVQVIGSDQEAAHAITTFDVEGDGDLDVVLGSYRAVDALVWFEQLPDGSFAEPRALTDQLGYAVHITSGDLDGDGDEDLLVAALLEGRVVWIENLGDGTWGSPFTLDGDATTAHAVLAYDLDQDGDLDVASVARDANEVVWFENTGTGVFATKTVLGSGTVQAPVSVAAGDLDGDGDIDIAAIAEQSDEVAWFENVCR